MSSKASLRDGLAVRVAPGDWGGSSDFNQLADGVLAAKRVLADIVGGTGVYAGGAHVLADLPSGTSYPAVTLLLNDSAGSPWAYRTTTATPIVFEASSGTLKLWASPKLMTGVSPAAATGAYGDLVFTARPAAGADMPNGFLLGSGTVVASAFTAFTAASIAPGSPLIVGGGGGADLLTGTGAPGSGLGADGDWYLDTASGDLYAKASGAWSVAMNLVGPAGADGAAGEAGAAGSQWHQGSAAPTTEGVNGDFYLRSNGDVYGPKTGGAWGSVVASLVGPTGAAGSNGTNGTDGRTVLNGSGAPGGGTGSNGDFYIDTTAHSIYGPKAGGAWGSGTSLVGPTGSAGAAGQGVPTGGSTHQVLRKINGTDYNTEWADPAAGASALDDLTDVTLTATTSGTADSALVLDGSHYVDAGADNLAGYNRSGFGAWVYPTSDPTSSDMRGIVGTYNAGTGNGWSLFQHPTGWYGILHEGGTNRQVGPATVPLNQWSRVWVQLEPSGGSSQLAIYVDGVSAASPVACGGGNFNTSTGDIMIGEMVGAQKFVGRVEDVCTLANGYLSAGQLTTDATTKPVEGSPHTKVWHLNGSLDHSATWQGGGSASYVNGKFYVAPTGVSDGAVLVFDEASGLWEDSAICSADAAAGRIPVADIGGALKPGWIPWAVDGLTLATTAVFAWDADTKYGPPSSGSHSMMEIKRDRGNAMWYCTASGTPGTWKQITPATVATWSDLTTAGNWNGGALLTGYIAWDVSASKWKVYNGSSWVVTLAPADLGLGTSDAAQFATLGLGAAVTSPYTLDVAGQARLTNSLSLIPTSGSVSPAIISKSYGGAGGMSFTRANGTVASPTTVAQNDVLGSLTFYGYDGGANRQAAEIRAYAYNTVGSGYVPGGMTFWTASDAGSMAIALTITSSLLCSFAGTIRANTLTASSLVATDASKNLTSTISGITPTFAGVGIGTAGGTLTVKTGSNARAGVATLVAGTVTVSTTAVSTSTSVVMVGRRSVGGTPGALYVSTITNGTSFVITSSNAADTSVVGWWIMELS